jgi:hypothetical protein
MPDTWLNLFGRNLSTEFRIDEFTLNVSTACLYASLGWRNKEAASNDQSGEPECRARLSLPQELEVGPNSKLATSRLAGDDLPR